MKRKPERKRGGWCWRTLIVPMTLLLSNTLAGCSLAQPEAAQQNGDRFAGFYMVCYEDEKAAWNFSEETLSLEEHGSSDFELDGYGALSIPNQVLFAEYDEESHVYTFPGMEDGYSLFLVQCTEEDGSEYTEVVSNMASNDEGMNISVADEGITNRISGVVYYGSPAGVRDWDAYGDDTRVWRCYRVYQTADDRIYINGGNAFSGAGGFGYHESETWTTTENGKSVTEITDVSVKVELVDRNERLVVTQFDGDHEAIASEEVDLRQGLQENLSEVVCEPAADWVLVEEISADGTARTVYGVPGQEEEPVSHEVVMLDERGLGQLVYLTIR